MELAGSRDFWIKLYGKFRVKGSTNIFEVLVYA